MRWRRITTRRPTAIYRQAPIQTSLTGPFEGLGHTIGNLSISDDLGTEEIGLFHGDRRGRQRAGHRPHLRRYRRERTVRGEPGPRSGCGRERGERLRKRYRVGDRRPSSASTAEPSRDSSAAVTVTGYEAGGLVRTNTGTILRCHATGSVINTSASDAGGLVTLSDGTIQDSYATGAVRSPAGSEFGGPSSHAGGLVGRLTGARFRVRSRQAM